MPTRHAGGQVGWITFLLQWIAEQPVVHAALTRLAADPNVQYILVYFTGTQDISPSALLGTLLALLGTWLFFASYVPKLRLLAWGTWYFFASSDKKTRPATKTHVDFANCQRKKIVFIRHGESEWNLVFNKGFGPMFLVRLIKALMTELSMLFVQDSVFFDSPLSALGRQQAWDLLAFLGSQKEGCLEPGCATRPAGELSVPDLVSIIRGDAGKSVVVSSNLKRAISTGVLCLSSRLLKLHTPDNKIHIMTSLQEISRNVDALATTPANSLPRLPGKEASMRRMGGLMSFFYRNCLDKKFNLGNKPLKMRGRERQDAFVKWVFSKDPKADSNQADLIIVCGHSLWFREFFRSFLPQDFPHVAKTSKMANCACVAFDLYRADDVVQTVRIAPESIKVVYLGFEGQKKKGKK
mmetsp:Transcript_57557/g.134852  ORF Transcript_57557/g.134852 Transcript_57557/m.134852 type:complete len:410 (-) Transcript_57557:105-1334(-)